MNAYYGKFRKQLPLLDFCIGPSTQEDRIIKHLLALLKLKSDFLLSLASGA